MSWSRLLAPLQFALGTVLALTSDPTRLVFWVFVAPAACVLVWAVATMRPTRISVHPNVRDDATLITDGPYGWVRHPMYSALLLMSVGFIASSVMLWRGIAFVVLVSVLFAKSAVEEANLTTHFQTYPAYRNRTGRFIPRIVKSSSERTMT